MLFLEILSIAIAAIAAFFAAGSLWVSRRTQQISTIQARPKLSISRGWSDTGERDLYITFEPESNRPDWVFTKATIKRTRSNWRRRHHLAHGEVIDHDQIETGEIIPITQRTGRWQRHITYETQKAAIAIFLHPDAPDCHLTLEITLNTSPSPTIKRHIKSPKRFSSAPYRQSIVE